VETQKNKGTKKIQKREGVVLLSVVFRCGCFFLHRIICLSFVLFFIIHFLVVINVVSKKQ